jgi:hypothetical protein
MKRTGLLVNRNLVTFRQRIKVYLRNVFRLIGQTFGQLPVIYVVVPILAVWALLTWVFMTKLPSQSLGIAASVIFGLWFCLGLANVILYIDKDRYDEITYDAIKSV